MADLMLNKPEAGQRVEFQNVADARLVLGFSPSDATMERVDDDLIFTFDDGSTVVLNEFYTAYNSTQLPDFEIDGVEVAGADFFAALDSSLMPAAGPAADAAAAALRNAAYRTRANMDLMDGIDRLDGLDIGFNGENPIEENLDGFGGDADPLGLLTPRVPMSLVAGEGSFDLKERGVGGADPNAPIDGVWVAEGFFTVNDNAAGGGQSVSITDAAGNALNVVRDPATGILTVDHPYGTLTVTPVANGDGSVTYRYSFMLDNERADSLNQGDSSNFTFNITVTNGLGESVNQPLDMTINGTNDRPELKLDVEDDANIAVGEGDTHEGTFTVGDADTDGAFGDSSGGTANQRYSITGTDAEGNPLTGTATDSPDAGGPATFVTDMGTLTVFPDGRYTFVPSEAAQSLNDGDSFNAGFTITVKDVHGANHSQNINISITGSNDAPLISGGTGQLTVTESNLSGNADANANNDVSGGTPSMSDSFTVKDMDATDKQQLGLKVMVNGEWVTPDASQITLDPATGQLVYHSEYGDLTITPQNATASTDEDGNIWLTPNDPSQGITYEYEFKLDNDRAEGLNKGDNPSLEFKIEVSDGESTASKDVNVTIKGANDIPLMGSSELTVTEAGVKDVNGDPNANFAGTEGVKVPGQIPPLNGDKFDPDNADTDLSFRVEGLNKGEWGKGDDEFSFTLTHADGSSESIKLEILNDDWQTVNNGTQTIVTNFGVLTLNVATGSYEFLLGAPAGASADLLALINGNISNLSQGDKLNFSFQATVTDGDKAGSNTIGISINGTNDRPELALDNTQINVGEDSIHEGSFTVGDADADGAFGGTSGDTANQRYSISGGQDSDGKPVTGTATDSPEAGGSASFVTDMGTLTINPDGSYTYVPSELAQALGRDESYSETFTVTVKDVHGANHSQDITINLKGSNDGPVLEGGSDEFKLVESNLSRDSGANYFNNASGGVPSMKSDFTVKDMDATDKQQLGLKVMVNGEWVTPDASQITLDPATGQLVYHSEYGDLTITPQNATASTDEDGNIWLTPNDPSQGITYEYEFKLDQGKSDSLNKGDNPSFDFKIEVSDGESTASKDVTVNIEGTNDIPLIGWSSVTVVEDGIRATGSNPNAAFEGTEGKWVSGQVSALTPGGPIDADNPNADLSFKIAGLGNGSNSWNFGKETLNFNIARANGTTDTTKLEILNDDWQTIGEDGQQTIITNYGVLTFNPTDGSYKFMLGAPEGASADLIKLITDNIQNLGQGDKLSLGFQVTVTDGDKTGTHLVGVSVLGTNDAPVLDAISKPVLDVTESGSYNNGGKNSDFGNATGSDDDANHTLTYGFLDANGKFVTSITDEYGTIRIDANGKYTYTLNNNGAVQGLTDGDVVNRKYTVVVKDEHGALSNTEDVSVSIKGADDAPVITKDVHVHNVVEEGVLPGGNIGTAGVAAVTGKITATDVDKDENGKPQKLVYSFGSDEDGNPIFTVETEYGTMSINPDTGAYTYTLKNDADAVNKLPAGATHSDKFTVTVTDPDGNKATQDVQINVKGTNDRPEIDTTLNNADTEFVFTGADGKQAGLVTEDANGDGAKQTFTGSVGANDDDKGDTLRFSFVDKNGNNVQTLEGDYGYITIDPVTGEYTYTLYNDSEAVQKLGKGDFADEKFEVRVTDKLGATSSDTVHIKVAGTDDAPSIGGDLNNGGVVEDGGKEGLHENPTATGTVTVSDVDAPNNGEGSFHTFYFKDANGNPTQTIEGEFGKITIDPQTGVYTYELTENGNLQHMNFDTGFADQFKVYVKNGYTTSDGSEVSRESSADLTVNIKGSNDNPQVDADQSSQFGNEGNIQLGVELGEKNQFEDFAAGHLVGTDVDDTAWTFHIADADGNQLQSGVGKYGSLVVAPDGTYTYQLNPYSEAYMGIIGQSAYDTFTVTVYDKHGGSTVQEITVKVNGVPPLPFPDGKPDYGDLPANPNSWKWSLAITVTEDKVGDNGLVSAEGDLKFWHDNSGQHEGNISGIFSFRDADGNLVQSIRTDYGLMRIDPNTGKVSFVLDNELDAVQSLKFGDKLNIDLDGVQVTVNGHDVGKDNGNNKGGITITVEGVNDRPDVDSAENLTFVEGAESVSGTVVGADVDTGTSFRYTLVDADGNPVTSLTFAYGVLTIDPATGKYTFTPAEGWEHKNADWADNITFKVRVDDQSGTDNATNDKDVTLTLKGTNTGPELTTENVTVTEDVTYVVKGSAIATDDTDGLRFRLTDSEGDNGSMLKSGTYGTLVLDPATGEYTYRLDNNHKDVQGLGAGESQTDTFYVTVTDKHGATETKEITVTINGTNDEPQLFVGSNLIIQDDGTAASASATATARDMDFSDTLDSGNLQFGFGFEKDADGNLLKDANGRHIPITEIVNEYGTFIIDPATGAYSFTLNPESAKLMGLTTGQMHTESVTVVVADSAGATDSRDISVHIKGTNSAPDVKINTHPTTEDSAVMENGAPLVGTFIAKDWDGSIKSVSVSDQSDYGKVVLVKTADGEWKYTYTLNSKTESLNEGERVQDTFTITVTDNQGKVTTKTVTVDIVGTNDAPVATNPTYDFDASSTDAAVLGSIANLGTDVDSGDATPDNPLDVLFDGADDAGNVTGLFGTLHFNSETGEYSYSLNTEADNLQRIAELHASGSDVKESFDYTVSDDSANTDGQLTVKIGGTNAGDEDADHNQLLLGSGHGDTMHGGFGDDYLSGGAGNDLLFGGAGDDVLYGGTGDDYLDGGLGSNQLYGGAGNDILVFNPANTVMDGGEGIDFLIGADANSLDSLLGAGSPVSNVEVFITSMPEGTSLTSMADLASYGITVNGESLSLSSGWQATDTVVPEGYAQYMSADGDMTIVVQRAILENGNG